MRWPRSRCGGVDSSSARLDGDGASEMVARTAQWWQTRGSIAAMVVSRVVDPIVVVWQ